MKITERALVKNLCVELGKNPLIVQGAGGNISWKDNNILWVKASGTWLCDAKKKNIFVPTNLDEILDSVNKNDFDKKPVVTNNSKLRPSIETILHALMPHRVVVHLHAVDALSYLVRNDCEVLLREILSTEYSYEIVKYCKPGRELAENVYKKIHSNKNIDIIFLMNHGLVVGADNTIAAKKLIFKLINKLHSKINTNLIHNVFSYEDNEKVINDLKKFDYFPSSNEKFHDLAINNDLLKLVENKWALFPDHVVFLGGEALVMRSNNILKYLEENEQHRPAFIFCKNIGTFQFKEISIAQIDQLNCFYDVAIRQNDISKVQGLARDNINDLIDWDAEKYRLSISK
jgi:rhamnose utilization protein RhaD (predicted bifunctional aldolase and dehydrogenase)